jgi:hypothetical protein
MEFNHPIGPNILPAALEILSFGSRRINIRTWKATTLSSEFNQPIDPGVLPPCLKELYFGDMFNHPLCRDVLPVSLQILHLPATYNYPIPEGNFRLLGPECEGNWPCKAHYPLVQYCGN